jgi:electron transport complex protein RnfG
MSASHASDAAVAPPVSTGPQVQAWRLLITLGVGGAIAGFLIVFVFGITRPTIEANKAAALDAAIQEVLKAPKRYDTLYVVNGALVKDLPSGTSPRGLERVYLGFTEDGRRIGFAIPAGEPGFQDIIGIIFGYDPATKQLIGMKVLETKETPGLGDKIEKDPFRGQFDGAVSPLVPVRTKDGKDRHQIQTVTGATISSKTVIRAINKTLDRLGPALEAYRAEGAR